MAKHRDGPLKGKVTGETNPQKILEETQRIERLNREQEQALREQQRNQGQ